MKMELLEDLYKQRLAELYDGEKQLLRILPRIAKVVPNPELKRLFEQHISDTKTQLSRLEQLVVRRGAPSRKSSKAVAGLLAYVKDLLKQEGDPQVLTLALISAAQDVEGHEISTYACAHNYARLLGFHEDLKPLEQTFDEEKAMEEKLANASETLSLEELDSETELEEAAPATSQQA